MEREKEGGAELTSFRFMRGRIVKAREGREGRWKVEGAGRDVEGRSAESLFIVKSDPKLLFDDPSLAENLRRGSPKCIPGAQRP